MDNRMIRATNGASIDLVTHTLPVPSDRSVDSEYTFQGNPVVIVPDQKCEYHEGSNRWRWYKWVQSGVSYRCVMTEEEP